MGYYVEVPHGNFYKAEQLMKLYGAREITQEEAELIVATGVEAVLCVVKNPQFEAVAFCHDSSAYKRFTRKDDPRPKTWLVVTDRPLIEKITGYAAEPVA